MRTNIDLDDKLIEDVMRLSGLKTKKEAVHRALLEYVHNHSQKDILVLEGKVKFAVDYDYKKLREGR